MDLEDAAGADMSAVRRALAASFEPFVMRAFDRAQGRSIRPAYHWLLRTQHLSRPEMAALQDDQLTRLFDHAHRYAPFYRERLDEAGWPRTRDPRATLKALPTLEKADIQTRLDDISTVARWKGEPAALSNTGGTTGAPTTFWVNSRARDRRVAATLRDQTWLGLRPGDPIAYIGGSSLGVPRQTAALERLKFLARNQLFLSAWDLSDLALGSYADQLERFAPKLLVGYAGAVHTLAAYLVRVGRPIPLPAVQTTAEMLYPAWRPTIEQAFATPVRQRYGTRELGDIAHSCAACGRMHVNDENLLVESNPDTGEIEITDLSNYATPFIRYRIGDRGTVEPPAADCHPGLSNMGELEGRTMDVLETARGHRVSAVILVHSLKDFPEIRAHQLWQPSRERVQVVVAADERPPVERIRAALTPHFDGTELEIIWTDRIQESENGKLRFVIPGQEYTGPRLASG